MYAFWDVNSCLKTPFLAFILLLVGAEKGRNTPGLCGQTSGGHEVHGRQVVHLTDLRGAWRPPHLGPLCRRGWRKTGSTRSGPATGPGNSGLVQGKETPICEGGGGDDAPDAGLPLG